MARVINSLFFGYRVYIRKKNTSKDWSKITKISFENARVVRANLVKNGIEKTCLLMAFKITPTILKKYFVAVGNQPTGK